MAEPLDEVDRGDGLVGLAWRRLRRDRLALFGLVLLGLILLGAVAGPLVLGMAGLDPDQQLLTQRFRPPGAGHPLGTDELGRDALARLVHGTRVSLSFGLTVGVVSLSLGTLLGLVSGYYRGGVDDTINAVIGTLQTVPILFLLITLSITFRPPFLLLAVLFGLLGWTGIARQVRGVTLSVRERQFVEAARALGAGEVHLLTRHLLPNVASIVLVLAGFDFAGAILGEAALSFLGFGVQVPTPSLGNLLLRSPDYLTRAPWLIAGPGLIVFLTGLGFFLVADGLRDALDPRLERNA
ncbi:MAG TPA: ABC transporter permease [Chloroflexota bacterium]|nr:ABC transporter permease [Chloroflexota bacterium]